MIYNAIDPAVFHPGLGAHRASVRARHGIAPDACVFLLVGSAYARKGVARALEALASRARARAPARGRPRPASGALRGARAPPRRGRTASTFAGAQTDPKPYYGAADAFVLPTLYDALSNAVLEALACGLPVVTSDRCGAGELVAAHEAGVVCGARDVGAIAAGMTALADPATRARAGANALAAMRPLTPDAMAARLTALYESLLPPR